MAKKTDIIVDNHGSICLLHRNTEQAREWIDQKVSWEQSWGDAIVVEPRYVPDIVCGAIKNGLTVVVR